MNAPKDGGPAFPMGIPEGVHKTHPAYSQKGMSKREYFAAIILSGMVADPSVRGIRYNASEFALTAVTQADELLAALSQEVES